MSFYTSVSSKHIFTFKCIILNDWIKSKEGYFMTQENYMWFKNVSKVLWKICDAHSFTFIYGCSLLQWQGSETARDPVTLYISFTYFYLMLLFVSLSFHIYLAHCLLKALHEDKMSKMHIFTLYITWFFYCFENLL